MGLFCNICEYWIDFHSSGSVPLWRLLLQPLSPALSPPGINPDKTGHLFSHSETGEWDHCGATELGIRSYLLKEGEKKARRTLSFSPPSHPPSLSLCLSVCDPVSEVPCCGSPGRRQLKAIRIQLLSGCTVQRQQQQQQHEAHSFKLNITRLLAVQSCLVHLSQL